MDSLQILSGPVNYGTKLPEAADNGVWLPTEYSVRNSVRRDQTLVLVLSTAKSVESERPISQETR